MSSHLDTSATEELRRAVDRVIMLTQDLSSTQGRAKGKRRADHHDDHSDHDEHDAAGAPPTGAPPTPGPSPKKRRVQFQR